MSFSSLQRGSICGLHRRRREEERPHPPAAPVTTTMRPVFMLADLCLASAVGRFGCAFARPSELFEVSAKGPRLAVQDRAECE